MLIVSEINPSPGCPLGPMTVGVSEQGVCLLSFSRLRDASERIANLEARRCVSCVIGKHPLIEQLRAELDAYFEGDTQAFTVPLDTPGTDWERRVWNALGAIPPGRTRSYGQVARSLGKPGGARAVGLANRRNPVAILIPCHRVVASDGTLHGYAGGLGRKSWLLDHEQSARPMGETLFGSHQQTTS